MTRPTLDHIIIKNTDVGHLFYCAHCRKGQFLALPMPLDRWLAESKRFMRAHRHCKPADETNEENHP